ncbi:hypothetical protein OXX69_004778 [Metschnikowia pulcherrima]
MSSIQKKAILKRASGLGLEPVAEMPTQQALAPPSGNATAEAKQTKTDVSKANDALGHAKRNVFPIQEKYVDPSTGLTFNTYYLPPSGPESPLFVCHHGAGSSGMTFWCLAKHLREHSGKSNAPGVFTFDARGHGEPLSTKEYHLEAFSRDFGFVISEFVHRNKPENSICLVGHSLGGAVLTDYITKNPNSDLNIRGLVIIDIVEETAVQSLLSMTMFLNKRPTSFSSYDDAIKWHLQSRMLRNEESARISIPELLSPKNGHFTWKTHLEDMAESWDTWFANFSQKFLQCNLTKHKLAKLLILSSNETLDKHLTIGQMQGKFQLVVFNNSTNAGHFLHEDIPSQIATSITDFMRRFSPANQCQQQQQIASLWGGKIHS